MLANSLSFIMNIKDKLFEGNIEYAKNGTEC